MTPPIDPSSYTAWKQCIRVLCRIPLTPGYIDAGIATLADPADYGAGRFLQARGKKYLGSVRGWFYQVHAKRAAGGAA